MSLTKEDLQAIDELFAHRLGILQEQYFDPRFKALAENQKIMTEKLKRFDELDEIEETLDTLYTALKAHSRRIKAIEQKAV